MGFDGVVALPVNVRTVQPQASQSRQQLLVIRGTARSGRAARMETVATFAAHGLAAKCGQSLAWPYFDERLILLRGSQRADRFKETYRLAQMARPVIWVTGICVG